MKLLFQRLRPLVVAATCGVLGASAQSFPLELKGEDLLFGTNSGRGLNLLSQRGVPISSTVNNPAGSDGRGPTAAAQGGEGLTTTAPTPGQFRGVSTFGALVVPRADGLGQGSNFVSRAIPLRLPRGANPAGQIVAVLRSAQVGGAFFARQPSFQFGSIISPPPTDENGRLLSQSGIRAEDYWLPEPHSTNGHSGATYYWSRNALQVFAVQSGPVDVVWKKAEPLSSPPADYASNPNAYSVQTGFYYRLNPVRYVVSGSPIREPKRLYWTEGAFRTLGKPVSVPNARVGAVNIVYNNNLPARVDREVVEPGQTQITETNRLEETRTIWYDQGQGQIFAYNREGRVFVELLGDRRGDGSSRQFLGFEIVDVIRQAVPVDVRTELGDPITPGVEGAGTGDLRPDPVLQAGNANFLFRHNLVGSDNERYYAVRETRNLNDQFVYWMKPGDLGLYWPDRLVRYDLDWPTDPARYQHYIRPEVATEAEAELTAVQLPLDNGPAIEYQDPLDVTRGKLTDRFEYYTFLNGSFPAHRALLRYTAGDEIAFERVFSWLDSTGASSSVFAGSVATNLAGWFSNSTTNGFNWPDLTVVPRVVVGSAVVGERLRAPSGEVGSSGTNYYAGHIRTAFGNSYHPGAYVDPFAEGFDLANRGAIIPVNAIPGSNRLEVLWFRPHSPSATSGFGTVHWPSVVARYAINWPAAPPEIVLASNAGSGALPSEQARGAIYVQNNPGLPGYNPNEEHAVMIGGVAWALRDDLNITSGPNYSSQPFVLLDYAETDGRPATRAFRVRREKPESGILFDYVAVAGRQLQAPMPLPRMPLPVEGDALNRVNYNSEPLVAGGDLPVGWDGSVDPNGSFAHYRSFTFRDRKEAFWLYRGLHVALPVLRAGRYVANSGAMDQTTSATAVVGQTFSHTIHATRRSDALSVEFSPASSKPGWITINNLTLNGQPSSGDVASPRAYKIVVTSLEDGAVATNTWTLGVVATGSPVAQAPISIASTNSYAGTAVTHVGRPPYLAAPPVPTNSFTMRFYYKTEAGFAWPGIASPPAIGSIVPYLRPRSGDAFSGDPASKLTPSLDVVYRPVWPANAPVLRYGESLSDAKNGLPEVRGQRSAGILYQQSLANDTNRSRIAVVLMDPTREKSADLVASGLEILPAGIHTEASRGKVYFPNLPPHLANRVFLDPARGTKGQLVFKGQRVDNGVGESFLLLNVLRGQDLESVLALCPASDPDKDHWNNLVLNLSTTLETFRPDPAVPGTFAPATNLNRIVAHDSLPEVTDPDTAVDSYALSASGPGDGFVSLLFGNGRAFTPAGEPVSISVIRVAGSLFTGELKPIPSDNPLNELFTLQHTPDLGGRFAEYEYEWRIAPPVDGIPPASDATMSNYRALTNGYDIPRYTLGGSGVQVLSDNYVVMRYRPANRSHPLFGQWSPWTTPQLVEGWIKRVLDGINPFNQRVADLFENQVNTDVSLITQAGPRWEGDVALNLDNIDEHGLIEIYETVLRRARSLSIDAGINDPGANDAMLLSAGYLNDLYMLLGNEALADAQDPTIGLGTQDRTYGDIATSLFSFKGQTASLLEEELALLRGRDESVQPGVRVRPIYNRLFWNFTRGINSGEVIYSLNYDICDGGGVNANGVVDASDARRMFPQGHGDAYGHFLTALKGYYSLLVSASFDWMPRTEAVTILGQSVQVDYMDERKFAAAAAAVAQAGLKTFDLTWRQDIHPAIGAGWGEFSRSRTNTSNPAGTVSTTRHWGADHWASRTGQGAYLHWIIGNAMLPAVDSDPTHEGIRKIDRTTVPELVELTTTGEGLQTEMDSAEGGLTVLGLPAGGIAFDIDPNQVVGAGGKTHFEQIEQRANVALSNAVAAFDDAKDVSRLLRSEFDSLADFQGRIDDQERAFENRLIELYGTPYPDDIGPGRTYRQDYAGPDLLHYQYVEDPTSRPGNGSPRDAMQVRLDLQQAPGDWRIRLDGALNDIVPATGGTYTEGVHFLTLNVSSEGIPTRPRTWTGSRRSPGRIQQALSSLLQSRARLSDALSTADGAKAEVDQAIALYRNELNVQNRIGDLERDMLIAEQTLSSVQFASDIWEQANASAKSVAQQQLEVIQESMPLMFIAGLAAGGDLTAPARGVVREARAITTGAFEWADFLRFFAVRGLEFGTETSARWITADQIAPLQSGLEQTAAVAELVDAINGLGDHFGIIDQRLRELDDARRAYRSLVSEAERIQEERLAFRNRSAALVQGYRTRDAAFRFFRSEKLERYKSLFDLAARYTYLAANAFDYETGLLGTERGRSFVQRITRSRSLGVVRNGQPQFAGSDSGDPGLSSVLAELAAEWSAVRGRLGLNNPDVYSTTASLRLGLHRILPGAEGNQSWKDILTASRKDNILADEDVRRHCLQLGGGNGLPVPGIVVEFGTVIAEGRNLFGLPLAAGDVAFSPSSFATKIYAAGVALEGYRGMDQPGANSGSVAAAGGVSPADPTLAFLDPGALSATPYVYLIPVGVDSMRSPPIGDSSEIRSWDVHDVTVPLPFDLGGLEAATREVEIGTDSLSESLFTVRGHQAFRAVGSSTVFTANLFGAGGQLIPSQYTNRRLIGRSAWNSRWKLVIPGSTLLNNPNEGLDRFIRTVNDIRIHLVTYSYSGN